MSQNVVKQILGYSCLMFLSETEILLCFDLGKRVDLLLCFLVCLCICAVEVEDLKKINTSLTVLLSEKQKQEKVC